MLIDQNVLVLVLYMCPLVVLCLVLLVNAVPLSWRDLAGLFGEDDKLDQSSLSAVTESSFETSIIRARTTAHTSHSTTTTATSSPPITNPTQSFSTTSTELNTALAVATSGTMSTSTAPMPIVPEAPTTSAEEATQWKVIGIGIITVGLIATVILLIIFFDSWWNFLCDLFCGRRRKRGKNQGEENMVPDWETRDWEFKLANENGHRYPTMSSLADITEGRKPPRELKLVPIPDAARLSPRTSYFLDLDFVQHSSREPLARKPSTR